MASDGRSACFGILFLFLFYYLIGDINTGIIHDWRSKDFSIVHQNIRGLLGKKELLADFILKNNIKIVGVTETLLNDSIPSPFVNINGYSFERRDRGASGGGVGVYIKSGVDYSRRLDLEQSNVELVCLEIFLQHTKPFFVCVHYRPPNSSKHLNKNHIENLQKMLTKLNNENKETIIIGDINVNYLDKTSEKPIKELLALQGLIQCIKGPTRVTDTSETLIDVILSTKPEHLSSIKVIPTSLSDHHAIGCVRKRSNTKLPFETIKCRNYANYNPDELSHNLKHEDWDKVYATQHPEIAWSSMKEILLKNINHHAPIISKKVKGKISPWLTQEIKTQMNYRDYLHRKFLKSKLANDFDSFKVQRNKVNSLVRKAKNQHSQTLLNESANNPNRFWKTLKNIFPIKEKVSCSKTFIIDNIITTKAKTVASSFCSFFSNIASKLRSKTLPLKNFIWAKPNHLHRITYNTFRFKQVTVMEVFKRLKKLSRQKASGPDDIPPNILKDVAMQIAKPLCYIINLSLKKGMIPTEFKIGRITPIYKSGSKHDMDNYRPITVLPVCSKILEKCIANQLATYLEENKLLSSTQFGFRKKRNTELAATLLLDEIRRNMDNGEVTGAIFIDLSKAFDTLSHAQIIESLSSYGVTGRERIFCGLPV